jgi:hypothetical protein
MIEEKFARPGLYLDEDDHERLLDENRDKYLAERRQRLLRELENVEKAMGE